MTETEKKRAQREAADADSRREGLAPHGDAMNRALAAMAYAELKEGKPKVQGAKPADDDPASGA